MICDVRLPSPRSRTTSPLIGIAVVGLGWSRGQLRCDVVFEASVAENVELAGTRAGV